MEHQKLFRSSYECQIGNIKFEFEPSYARISFDNQDGFHQIYLEKNKDSLKALKRLVRAIFNVEEWDFQPDDFILPNATPFEQAFGQCAKTLNKDQEEHIKLLAELQNMITAYLALEMNGELAVGQQDSADSSPKDGQALADRTAKIEF